MSRVEQRVGERGSLKWIQRAVNNRVDLLDQPILERLPGAASLTWVSPRSEDKYAEYRDQAFLHQLGVTDLDAELAAFWPARGPQWDALGRTDAGDLLLVEAKAHVAEALSPATQAGEVSRARIARALDEAAKYLGAEPKAPWTDCFFQYANRLAHLYFLRKRGRPAWLVLCSFVGDQEMGGPTTAEAWTGRVRRHGSCAGTARQSPPCAIRDPHPPEGRVVDRAVTVVGARA